MPTILVVLLLYVLLKHNSTNGKNYIFLHYDFSHYTEIYQKEMSFKTDINRETDCSTMNLLTYSA